MALALPVEAQAPGVREYEVKAAFLYNFTKFIQWPERVDGGEQPNFALGILGEDPFGESIHAVTKGKTVGGRPIEVRKARRLSEILPCQILFISASENERIEKHLEMLRGSYVLTVSDAEDFARRGGMIRLFLESNRVRFSINHRAVERSGIRMSSKLLALAQIVEEDE